MQPVSRPEGDASPATAIICCRSTGSRGQDLAGFQLSLCPQPRGPAALARNGEPDPYHGHKMRYVNPASGESAMPTIGTFMQLLPKGFAGSPYRSTDGTVFVAVEGEGETRGRRPGHALAAARHLGRAELDAALATMRESEAVLFSYSDRPVQEKLGLWREQRGNA